MTDSKRILILFAHPNLNRSRVQKTLIQQAHKSDGVTVNDLYENYPDFDIDVDREKKLLIEHDIIIWQHPIYWYSCPPLLKQWIDMVLEFGWAYGKDGTQLEGKWILNCVSSGGSEHAYQTGGRNRYSINEFLRPFEQTATLCHMTYLPPFALFGVNRYSDADLQAEAKKYIQLLHRLSTSSLTYEMLQLSTINSWCTQA